MGKSSAMYKYRTTDPRSVSLSCTRYKVQTQGWVIKVGGLTFGDKACREVGSGSLPPSNSVLLASCCYSRDSFYQIIQIRMRAASTRYSYI